jgi:hypothetical protein
MKPGAFMDTLILGLVGSFHWPWICRLSQVNWFVFPLWGRGNNLEIILLISPVTGLSDPISPLQGAGMQIYNSFSGCRNDSALHGGDGILICFRSPDLTVSALQAQGSEFKP